MSQSSSDPFALIIFGITGNLAQKYLLQALYDMVEADLLPEQISIIGNARKKMSREEFETFINDALHKENVHHHHEIKAEVVQKLLSKTHYIEGSLEDPNFYPRLKEYLTKLTADGRPCDNRIYYLAVYPELYPHILEGLKQQGLDKEDNGWVRLMVEKPVGHDLPSSKELNKLLTRYFNESQIYRLDHYLGKETIQNILTFRFANGIFEPILNKAYVDHIQVSALENFGIGQRGGYYDSVGALIDVGQNHQLQMLAVATMDDPGEFTNEAITRERVKILQSLRPLPEKVVYGQYEGYLQEANVKAVSKTETFYALKTYIDNERFKDVPIYIRAGKKLGIQAPEIAEIAIVFKRQRPDADPTALIYRIQPNEGIVLRFLTKQPGEKIEVEPDYMQFCYKKGSNGHYLPDPYENLISDTINGNQTFFNDSAETEAEWAFIDALVAQKSEPEIYHANSMGPKAADELIEADGRKWLEPTLDFCRI